MRRFHVLACDYDGTLANHGRVDRETLDALEQARRAGCRLLMVTGRRLDELLDIFPAPKLFERIVAENGAVIFTPENGAETLLAEPPPPRFVEHLQARGVGPIAVGRAIVATWEPHETQVLETIRDMGLGLQIILNKGAVMILPSDVSKATGLKKALDQLGYSPRNTVAVGDAENDHALLEYCECGAAVANALPALKDRADIVLARDHGAGVRDLIEQLLQDDLAAWTAGHTRRHLEIGRVKDQPLKLSAHNTNLRLESARVELLSPLLEQVTGQLSAHGYQWCGILCGPSWKHPEAATVLGTDTRAPSLDDIMKSLERPRQSVLVHCGALHAFDRTSFLSALAAKLVETRAAFGRPHWTCWCGLGEALHAAAVDLESLTPGLLVADARSAKDEALDSRQPWVWINDRRGMVAAADQPSAPPRPGNTLLDWIDSPNGSLHFAPSMNHAPAAERVHA